MTLFKIYEVWRNTPMGDTSMGLFLFKRNALKMQADWNATIKSSWDEANITVRKILL